MDLFHQLSERGEMTDQLGRNALALKRVGIVYSLVSAFMAIMLAASQPAVAFYLASFLVLTAFLLVSVLVSEAGNSLINPQEAMVLAHQPINGATYTAAKLSHLLQIVLYLVAALDAIPAFAGLVLKGSAWYYPILHLAAALTVGLVAALLCCALFGWLIRFVPVRRLKAAGQLVGTLPLMGMMWGQELWRRLVKLQPPAWLPASPGLYRGLEVVMCAVTIAAVALGIRSLSADYLIRVSGMTRGGATAGSRTRRSLLATIVRRFFGGQPALAGFAFVSKMMLRDWQFRRQMFPMSFFALIGLAPALWGGWPTDPFSADRFSSMHLLPHVLGSLLFFICGLLPYGNDYKGGWIFLSVPPRAIDRFVRGIFAVLWIDVVVIPNLIALPLFAWRWGIWHAGLFIAYSVSAASVYLGLELRLVESVPFSQQMDTSGQAMMLPLMIGGGIVGAIAVSLQYFLIFRSPVIVAVTTVGLAFIAYLAVRASLGASAASVRYNLGVASGESGRFLC
jgi:hypothetical protein